MAKKKKSPSKRVHKRVVKKPKAHTVRGQDGFCSVYIVCADREEALKIAQTLVSEKLVACFNLFENVTSIYHWNGELEKNSETALIGKTQVPLQEQILARVKKLHSYEVPAVVFWPIEAGLQTYLDWVRDNTKN